MDLSNPKPPNDDKENNAINHFDSAEENDYINEIKNPGRNSSTNTPALKDQSHRLHRSSSNMMHYNVYNNNMINIVLFIMISLLLLI